VYDSLACKGLKRMQRRGSPKYAEYAEYVSDFVAFGHFVFPGESLTREKIKQLDGFLIAIGDSKTNLVGLK
jgi:hypothetical protein